MRATLGCVTRNAGFFGLVGGVYTGVDCLAEDFRGKKDMWNGVYGGLAAGQVITFKSEYTSLSHFLSCLNIVPSYFARSSRSHPSLSSALLQLSAECEA